MSGEPHPPRWTVSPVRDEKDVGREPKLNEVLSSLIVKSIMADAKSSSLDFMVGWKVMVAEL